MHAGFPCVLSTAGPEAYRTDRGAPLRPVGDPCRTRTRVRCVRGSRPTARRTGHGCRCAEGGGFEPRGLSTPTGFRYRAPATPATPSQPMVSPVRFERTTPAFGGQRSVPLSWPRAPEARFKLTTGASHAPVLFTTPPGSDTQCGALQATRTGTRTRTSRIDGPALLHRAHAPGGRRPRVGLAGIEPAASAPRTPCAPSLRHSPLSSGGRRRSPALLVQSQMCCRLHHSRTVRPRRIELRSAG